MTAPASPIRPRRARFDWRATPIHWVPGDPQTTHTINVLHLLLPAGERWFVHVYRQVLPLVTDERLHEDLKGFMGQEAIHSRAHAGVLDHLAAQGLDTSPYTDRIEAMFDGLLGDDLFGRRRPRWLEGPWLRQRLAIIAAIEHFTAVLGAWVIDSPGLDAAHPDPAMLDLLRWHGAEEVEHRSVAFDTYQHLAGGHGRRFQAMLVVCAVMTYLWVAGTRFLMAHDPTEPGRATWRGLLRAGRTGRLPTVGLLARSIPRYLRRSYHPSQEGSTDAALAYLATSPAAAVAS